MFWLEISVVVLFVSLAPKEGGYLLISSISSVHCANIRIIYSLQQVSGQTVDLKQTVGIVGRQHASRIRFFVAPTLSNKVVDFYFLVWSLSIMLCCVGSSSNVALP
jgi:hypothetical protein